MQFNNSMMPSLPEPKPIAAMNEMSMDIPTVVAADQQPNPSAVDLDAPVIQEMDDNEIDFNSMMILQPEARQHNGTFYIDKNKAKELYSAEGVIPPHQPEVK